MLLASAVACGRQAERSGVEPAAASAAAAPPPEAPPAAPAQRLEPMPDLVLERELLGGDVHAYLLRLEADTFLELVAEQQGVDLVLTLLATDGEPLIRIDSPTGAAGEERLRAVTAAAGDHRLEISAPWQTEGGGHYTLSIAALRPALAVDGQRFAADRLFAAAEQLREAGDPASARRAVERYEQAEAAARALGDRLRQAHAADRVGWIHRRYLDQGRLAIPAYQRAADLFAALDMPREEAGAVNDLGRVCYELGDMAAAATHFQRALSLWRRVADEAGEASTLNNLALVYLVHGNVQDALSFYDQAVARMRRLELPADETRVLFNRGSFYRALGKEREALDDLERSLELARRVGARPDQAAALAAIGEVREQMGEPEAARPVLEQALALRRELGQPRGIARALHSLAAVDAALGRQDEALRGLREALQRFRVQEATRDEAALLVSLGWQLWTAGQPAAALAPLGEALAHFEAFAQPEGEALALLGMARAQRDLGALEDARSLALRGLERIEQQRVGAVSHELRAAYFARQQDHYDFAVDLLMTLHRQQPGAGHDGEALAVSERSRARSLLESLVEQAVALRTTADPRLLAREQEIRQRLAALELARGAGELAAARAAALDQTLRQLLRELDDIGVQMRAASPRYAALTRPRPLSADAIQRRVVDEETVLLAYDLGPQHSYLWLVAPEALSSYQLPAQAEIETAARQAHELLVASRQREAAVPTALALARLGHMLLGPVADQLAGRRLLVVADGALHYLPFGALTLPTAAAPSGGTEAVPLLANHEVVQMASASALAVLRQQLAGRPPAPALAAVLADPVFSADDPRLPPGAEVSLPKLPRLVHSGREAAALRDLAPAGAGLFALGFEASRALATGGELARFQIVHFATHGELDAEHPALSHLVLSRFDSTGQPRQGALFAHEIYGLELPAELVVLSACRTALGAEVRGEGLVGLTQAFFYAGAARILVSLWQVDDRATAALMARFYQALLQEGRPPAAALRAAQLAIRQESGWSAPYYWAGFVLHGEWRGTLAPRR